MLELVIMELEFSCVRCLYNTCFMKIRKNHNHETNSIWVGNRAIIVLCVRGNYES